MAVQLQPGNKAAVFALEGAILTMTEKSVPSSQQYQVNSDHFFLTFQELCIRSLFHLVDYQWNVLLRGFEMTEGKCEVQTA
jgi:hypothetical protein